MWGIFGRTSHKFEGFAYSAANKIAAIGRSVKHWLEHLATPKEYHYGAPLAAPQASAMALPTLRPQDYSDQTPRVPYLQASTLLNWT